jgi:predicted dehydrogenase
MPNAQPPSASPDLSRREFLKVSAAAGAGIATAGVLARVAYAAGSDTVKIGLVGCGGRGTADAKNCVEATPGVVLWGLADLFRDRLDPVRANLQKALGEKMQVTDERCFTGFDNCAKLLASGIDLVLLCEPPGFRPMHLKMAVEAGKHVFAEKPVCVDPVGARSVIATSELAAQKKLAIVAGTQSRHDALYVESMKRILDGQIGPLVGAQCYFLTGTLWYREPKPGWSEMENQCRNWYYYTWLSGDHIVEQHVHNIDRMNWAFGGPPAKCIAVGGRQVRTEPKWGDIFDHFAVEYEYPNGARVASYCAQFGGKAAGRTSDRIVGADGVCDFRGTIDGKKPWKFEGDRRDPNLQEHTDLVTSIRSGNPLNDGKRIAESSLTAVMGRMAAYTGREIKYSWVLNASNLNLFPAKLEFGPHPVDPVAMPGQTPLVAEGEVDPNPPKAKGGKAKKAAK